ncbi:17882_t:CDS:2 [Entrophospora sp. SA101]|nr:7180_t:CDS:2 [Entrophospora sp. SA101]CAJ0649285.1 13350_t:CDS:2 [Entrophospora sp. SA101]CAJ0751290.1 17882_t:CDS:2 [Entrophospora sp. SA101]CAJ0837181.1 1075_t:CDS:2 [Entrophospora sp. SA101]CAJ0840642.1 6514_t:CDS:2 [Entrophospora sp. SA101]
MFEDSNKLYVEITGYISIFCWVVVLMPQLYTNYKRKSSDSLSLVFLFIWLAGDALNLLGCILQGLLPTMIILASYYVFSDFVLLFQVFYYRNKQPIEEDVSTSTILEETSPLLQENLSSLSAGHGKRVKKVMFAFALFIACFIGVTIYYISSRSQQISNGGDSNILNASEISILSQLFGWASAILYLSSRIPQIKMNFDSKSTEGLSFVMFFFSVMGNVFYCLSIFLYSTDYDYLLENLPWIVGSGGTLGFDFIIFAQFYLYRNKNGINNVQNSSNTAFP